MKKILGILLAVIMAATTCSCASNINVEEAILDKASMELEQFGLIDGRTFSVILDEQKVYHIDINGTELLIQLGENHKSTIQKTNIAECDSAILEVASSAKNIVIKYINDSNILKEKEELIEYIKNIPLKMAEFSEDAAVEYDLETKTIFICKQYKADVSEWLIVHELIHALCDKTNGGKENLRYPYHLFSEVLTDILTAELNPKIQSDVISGYSPYYQLVYLYLGCVGSDGIDAYFYGYDKILEKIPETELEMFVESMEQLDSYEYAIVIINNCINEWGLELK